MNTDIQKLKAAALAATPGPWEAIGDEVFPVDECEACHPIRGYDWDNSSCRLPEEREKDAQFIALANPAAILDLIAAVESAQSAPFDIEATLRRAFALGCTYAMQIDSADGRENLRVSATADNLGALIAEAQAAQAAPQVAAPAGFTKEALLRSMDAYGAAPFAVTDRCVDFLNRYFAPAPAAPSPAVLPVEYLHAERLQPAVAQQAEAAIKDAIRTAYMRGYDNGKDDGNSNAGCSRYNPARIDWRLTQSVLEALGNAVVGQDAVYAARYRWLREKRDIPHGARNIPWVVVLDPAEKIHTMVARSGAELDAAIDAAINSKKGGAER